MTISYFLGANTKDGFYSLYNDFAANPDDKLHIIKSGPGTGKSGFMRAIGKEAERRGYDVHYVLCSGDPASFDGVYIPEIREGWVDGTSPHVLEPRHFGIDGDYVNLGPFCRNDFTREESASIELLYDSYQAEYKRAYGYLNAAGRLECAALTSAQSEETFEKAKKRIDSILDKATLTQATPLGMAKSCFISAVSCQGFLRLNETVKELCKLIYAVDDRLGGAQCVLTYVLEKARARGMAAISCPSPLDPSQLEAVLLCGYSLAFVGGNWGFDSQRHIRLDDDKASKAERREASRIRKAILALAYTHLAQAKAKHDLLEKYYISRMDYAALTAFTEKELSRVFA